MKEIVISVKRQKKELLLFGICFALSFAMNIVAIIIYDTRWTELFTHIGYVAAISLTLYVILAAIRLCIYAAKKLFSGK